MRDRTAGRADRGGTATRSDKDRVMVVTRHPRAGREIRAFGGAGLFRGKDVLDVGTGNGRLALDLARHARRVLGIDPSEESVSVARKRAEVEGLRNVEFRVGDAASLDVGRARFDIALFSWSL